MINKIYIETESRNVYPERDVLGISGENKFETLQFNLDNFIDGQALLRVERKETTGVAQYEIAVEKGENCYTLEVLSSLLAYKGIVKLQLVIMQENLEVFKSKTFNMKVLEEIEGDEEIPEQYPTWQQLASQKIIEINNKIEEVTALEEDLEDKVESGYFKGEKGDTGEPGQDGTNGIDGHDGVDGQDAKINGVNTLTIEAGSNINLEQEGNTLTISSIGGGTSNYQDLTNKPSINNVTLTGNKSLSDLGIQPAGNYLTSETDPTVPSYVKNITQENINNWNNKSDFSGNYNDLSNKPTIPAEVTENTVSGWGFTKNTGTYSKPQNGIPKTDLESAVQASLDKADTALQTHQDISGKLDTNKVKNTNSTTAGDVYDVRYINSVLGDIETLLQEV